MNSLRSAVERLSVCLLLCINPVFAETAVELPAVALSPAEEAEVQRLVLPVPANWVGDFEGMRERRLIRVLVPYSRTFSSSIVGVSAG